MPAVRPSFGSHAKTLREALNASGKKHSLRSVAKRVGIEPSYLSKIERGDAPPPGEETILKMAAELGEDPDVFLAMAGKVSAELREIITKRPAVFAALLRQLREAPDHAILKVVREVRDGDW